VTRRDPLTVCPRLKATILGETFDLIRSFTITGNMVGLSDTFTFDLPMEDDRVKRLFRQDPHRFTPIVLQHSDPLVRDGEPMPALMGVITRAQCRFGNGATVLTLSGYDLGILYTSCGPPWYRPHGHTYEQLVDVLTDSAWRQAPTVGIGLDLTWGIKGVCGVNLNRMIKLGRAQEVIERSSIPGDILPPIQIAEGEPGADTLARVARLIGTAKGCFVSMSADGWLCVYNPDDYASDPPVYQFTFTHDEQNGRIKGGELVLDGSDLYTSYQCFGTVIEADERQDPDDPNAGKFSSLKLAPTALRVPRRLTWLEAEQWTLKRAEVRAEWRRKNSEYNAWQLVYEIAGHSMPGAGALSGQWVPLVEGQTASVRDEVNNVRGDFLIESVTRMQADAPMGSSSRVVLRRRGLLGA
jgi:hypothetical protein